MKNIQQFLSQLAQNNTREWMDANREVYQSAKKEFEDRVGELIVAIAAHDPSVAHLRAKDAVFRLARDIRFSKDKTPYKTNFAAGIAEEGRKSAKAFYYFHFQPGNSFIASGMYLPEREILQKIRQEIDYNAEELLAILKQEPLRTEFGEMDTFPEQRLKTAPRGYPKDHPHIELLRKKSFILGKPLPDAFFRQPDWIEKAAALFALTMPFNAWLNLAFVGDEME